VASPSADTLLCCNVAGCTGAIELHTQLEHLKDRAAIYKVPPHLAPLSLTVERLHADDCCRTGACQRAFLSAFDTCLRVSVTCLHVSVSPLLSHAGCRRGCRQCPPTRWRWLPPRDRPILAGLSSFCTSTFAPAHCIRALLLLRVHVCFCLAMLSSALGEQAGGINVGGVQQAGRGREGGHFLMRVTAHTHCVLS
jgi:hypothetical protein